MLSAVDLYLAEDRRLTARANEKKYRLKNPKRMKEKNDLYREKNTEYFRAKARERQAKLRKENPELMRARNKAWRDANPDSMLNFRLKRAYGITLAEYTEMLKAQGGACVGCGRQPTAKKRLCVDHCHTTGKIRGLLCSNCNTALGLVGENKNTLHRLAAYACEATNVV
jgi:hypothetical protein